MIRVLFCDSLSLIVRIFSEMVLLPSCRAQQSHQQQQQLSYGRELSIAQSPSSAGADCQIIGKPKDRVECFSNIPSFLQCPSYDQHLSQRLACNQTIVVVLQLHEDVYVYMRASERAEPPELPHGQATMSDNIEPECYNFSILPHLIYIFDLSCEDFFGWLSFLAWSYIDVHISM